MANSIFGYWMRPSDPDENIADYLWIGENGRIVHRINYGHGPFVMTLWSKQIDDSKFEVRLKPKSDPHHVIITCEGDCLTLEHLDLKNPKSDFERIGEDQINDLFEKDLKWAQKTMDKQER
ncbi:MAG: hypothetical protein P1V20_15240 [Verrucomicrobiales bacterium]|nr:hypothetical protein [Verrucomicrobiales bacterium]